MNENSCNALSRRSVHESGSAGSSRPGKWTTKKNKLKGQKRKKRDESASRMERLRCRDDVSMVALSVQIGKAVLRGHQMQLCSGPAIEYYLQHVRNVLDLESSKSYHRVEAALYLANVCQRVRPALSSRLTWDCVYAHLSDRAVPVRQAMVRIAGYLSVETPELMDLFYGQLARRLSDKQSSVRREAIITLAMFAECHYTNYKVPDILGHLTVISDPENAIEMLVLDMFRHFWLRGKARFWGLQLTKVAHLLACSGSEQRLEDIIVSNYRSGKELHEPQQALIEAIIRHLSDPSLEGLEPAAAVVLKVLLQSNLAMLEVNFEKIIKSVDFRRVKSSGYVKCYLKVIPLFLNYFRKPKYKMEAIRMQEALLSAITQHGKAVMDNGVLLLHNLTTMTQHTQHVHRAMKEIHYSLLEAAVAFQKGSLTPKQTSKCKRLLYVYGLLLNYFDSKRPIVRVERIFLEFLQNGASDIGIFAMKGIGNAGLLVHDSSSVEEMYTWVLYGDSLDMKLQVVNNLLRMLQRRGMKAEAEPTAHRLMQSLLQPLLHCYLTPHLALRTRVALLVALISCKGAAYIPTLLPCLIAMCTDVDPGIGTLAQSRLTVIHRKHPSTIHTRAVAGMSLSYRLHTLLCKKVAGHKNYEALHSYLFSVVRQNRSEYRMFMMNLLVEFTDAKPVSDRLWFFTENMAYFPYTVIEEVLFTTFVINAVLAVQGFDCIVKYVYSVNCEPNKYHVLLKLLRHLQERYQYSDDVIYAYSPHTQRTVWDRPARPRKYPLFPKGYSEGYREYAEAWLKMWKMSRSPIKDYMQVLRRSGALLARP